MKQLLEFLPLVLFFGAYQMDGEIVTVGSWSHTFDGIFSATAVLMVSSIIVWLLASALSRQKERRLMWMAISVVVFGAATLILSCLLYTSPSPRDRYISRMPSSA